MFQVTDFIFNLKSLSTLTEIRDFNSPTLNLPTITVSYFILQAYSSLIFCSFSFSLQVKHNT